MGSLKEYVYKYSFKGDLIDKLAGVNRNSTSAGRSVERMSGKMGRGSAAASQMSGAVGSLYTSLKSLIAIGSIVWFVNNTAQAESMGNAIRFASGSSMEYAKNIKFLDDISDEMGLSLTASKEGFKTLAASMMGSKLQGQATRDIFRGVSMGVSAMGLSSEQTKGSFLALGQMMGKGKVSAEELRGQLGERIPGAFNIAARAMGVSTAQLDKMLVNGELMAEDFLPKFAKEMERTFSGALPKSTMSLQANINRMMNGTTRALKSMGTTLSPLINMVVVSIGKLLKYLMDNKEVIYDLAKYVGIATGVFLIYKTTVIATAIYHGVLAKAMTISRLATVLSTGGFRRLNMVLKMNPIGIVITLLLALAAGFLYAYQKSDKFRAALWGLWEGAKQVFTNIGNFFKTVFDPIFKAIDNFKKGDYLKAGANVLELGFNLTPVGLAKKGLDFAKTGGFTKGVGAAYDKGAAYGMSADSKMKKPAWLKSILGEGSDTAAEGSGEFSPSTTADLQDGLAGISGGGGKALSVIINNPKFAELIEINGAGETQEQLENMRQWFYRMLNGAEFSVQR